ncbi:hypothetical protein ACWPM1_07020 [Tsuneonella sp. HG249]
MDGMLGKVYLSRTMLRRILACFALITGLATVGSPAQARMMAVMSQSVVEGSQTQAQSTSTACEIVPPRAELRNRATKEPCRPRKPVVIVIPTIQLGPDRARE